MGIGDKGIVAMGIPCQGEMLRTTERKVRATQQHRQPISGRSQNIRNAIAVHISNCNRRIIRTLSGVLIALVAKDLSGNRRGVERAIRITVQNDLLRSTRDIYTSNLGEAANGIRIAVSIHVVKDTCIGIV